MFKTWSAAASNGDELARGLEAHLNEFADEVISVAYAVNDLHYVLAVYRPVDATGTSAESAAVTVAEHIIEGFHQK